MKTNWRTAVVSIPAIVSSIIASFVVLMSTIGSLSSLQDIVYSAPYLLIAIASWMGVAWAFKAQKLGSAAIRSGVTFVCSLLFIWLTMVVFFAVGQ